MPGILNSAQPQRAPEPPQQTPETAPQQGAQQGDTQQVFDKLVKNALRILSDEKTVTTLSERLRNTPDAVAEVGTISLEILKRLEQSSQGKVQITAGAIVNGLNVIVGAVIDIAQASGAEKFTEEERYQAYVWALGNYISEAVERNEISKEDLAKLGESVKQQSPEVNDKGVKQLTPVNKPREVADGKA